MSADRERGSAARRTADRRARPGAWRAPGWVVPVVAAASGWAFAGWMGAVFGAVVGTFIWKSR